jgi:hypothetical protein
MYDKIQNGAGTSKVKVAEDSVGAYIQLNGWTRLYMLTIALTDGLTTTAGIGSLAQTTHGTGQGEWWRADSLDGGTTKKWFRISKGERSFVAVLNQAGTAAPTISATYMNQLGATPTLSRTGVGVYLVTLTGAFAKAFCVAVPEVGSTGLVVKITAASNDNIAIGVFDAAGAAVDLVGNMKVEIKVYP